MLIFVFKQRLKKYVPKDFCLNSGCIFKIIIIKGGNFARNVYMPIPGTVEPGGLPSMGSHRVGHDWSDSAAAAAYLHTPVWPIIFYRKKHTFELLN